MQGLLADPQGQRQAADIDLVRPGNNVEHAMMDTRQRMGGQELVSLDRQDAKTEMQQLQGTIQRMQRTHLH